MLYVVLLYLIYLIFILRTRLYNLYGDLIGSVACTARGGGGGITTSQWQFGHIDTSRCFRIWLLCFGRSFALFYKLQQVAVSISSKISKLRKILTWKSTPSDGACGSGEEAPDDPRNVKTLTNQNAAAFQASKTHSWTTLPVLKF